MLLGATLLASAGVALADSNADRAAALNEEGKDLMYDEDFAAAADKFSQAVNLSPEGRFYFNLCMANYQLGKFRDAVVACEAAEANTADAALKDKSRKLLGAVKDEAKKQGVSVEPPPPDGGGGTNPDGSGGTNPDGSGGTNPDGGGGVGAPPQGQPPASLFVASKPEHAYTWSLGAELAGGPVKFADLDKSFSAVGLRGIFDYYIMPKAKIGLQGTLTYASVQGEVASVDVKSDIVDFGGAVYRHFCSGRICATPQVGLNIGVVGVNRDTTDEQQTTIGLRLGGGVGYAFGQRLEHVVGATLGANLFSVGESSDGFREGTSGRWINFGVGYTYRFNTPLGSSPFVTLE
jgi:hypothetical protein